MKQQAILSKLAAVAILVSVVGLLAAAAWPMAQRYSDNADTIADLRQSLGRFDAISDYRSQLDDAQASALPGFFKGWFLEPAPQAIAMARLQSRLKAIAAKHGGQIFAANEVEPRRDDNLTYLGVRISMVGPIAALHGTLREVETGRPYLFVESASFRADRNASRASAPDAVVRLQLVIYGVQQTADGQADGESDS